MIACIGLLISCSSGNTSSDENQETPTLPSTLASTSVVDSDVLIQGKWAELTSSSRVEFPFAVIERIGNSTIGVIANSGNPCSDPEFNSGEARVFEWKGEEFQLIGTIPVIGFNETDLITFCDVTDDGVPELLIQVNCYEDVLYVHSVGPQGLFEVGRATGFSDGVLYDDVETCEPDCASGGRLYFELKWNGQDFDRILKSKELPYVTGRNFAGQDITSWDMEGWDLTGADLNSVYAAGVNLRGANLTGANLASADLTGADLTGANLTGTDLYGTNFRDAILESADFRGADMLYTVLSGANLRNANLTGQDLVNVSLYGATMPDGSINTYIPPSNDDEFVD